MANKSDLICFFAQHRHTHDRPRCVRHLVRCVIQTLLQTTNRKWYMVYRIVAIPMKLSEVQGHSRISNLFKWNFLQLGSS